MEFGTKFTVDDLDDLGRLLQPKWFWPQLVLEHFQGLAIVAAIIWVTILALLGRTTSSWLALTVIWLVVLGVFGWGAYAVRRERTAELAQLNDDLPDRVRFTNEGAIWDTQEGNRAVLHWAHVKGWRERSRVLVLDGVDGSPAMILPIGHLTEVERQSLRDYLRSQIPPSAPWVRERASRS